ncbi:MAG TPA: 3'-5' exonuclease, partial [Chthoniobacterales bacterium]|nr:3'-5' exonuclease [Chthoniobacterales bacterium]
VEGFSASLQALDAYAVRFDDSVCDELATLWKQVTKWNAAGAGADRAGILAALRSAAHAQDPGFLAAAQALVGSGAWIDKKRHAPVRSAVEASAALELAGEVAARLARLQWDFRNEILGEVRETVSAALRASRQITYDGLIDVLCAALRGPQSRELAGRLRQHYRVALIDESQDTDARQFEIFRKIFVGFEGETPLAAHRLVLIGDPKQAIYAFRGADVNTYLQACRDAGDNIFRLTRTYRAPEALVRAVNALFGRDDSLLKEGLSFKEGSSGIEGDVQLLRDGEAADARIEAWCVPDADGDSYSNATRRLELIAGTVASEIVRILSGTTALKRTAADGSQTTREVQPGDIAILVNSHREAEAMSEALNARNVTAIRAGDEDVMASEEAQELLVLLRALHEPRRTGFRLAALATRLLGRGSEDLEAIRNDSEKGDASLQQFVEWQEHWHRFGIAAALARIDQEEHVSARLAPLARGERRVTNLRQIIDLTQSAALDQSRRPGHLVRWLAQEVARASGRSNVEERQQQLESDADAVQIVTMHAAKGLEYPLVFCPFLWSSRKPDGVQKLSVRGQPPQLVEMGLSDGMPVIGEIERAALEDRLRLAYVAVTRAKVKAWILGGEICGSRNRPPASALDWLLRSDGVAYDDAWKELAGGPGRGGRHGACWEQLVGSSEGSICVGQPPLPSATKWAGPENAGAQKLSALPAPLIPVAWRMTSFSALTKEKNSRGGAELPVSPIMGAAVPAQGHSFLNAPGGAMVGTAVHDWIEEWDFTKTTEETVARHLARFSISTSKDAKLLSRATFDMLEELRTVELPGLGCTIEDACPNARSSEWHFQLPIGESLSSQRIADVFAAHGLTEYAAILASLPVEELAGYLHGFLDRIAFHDGAWGVIDWKTNNLGPGVAHYGPASLEACAYRSHYLLQAHLYLVALRRYLGPKVPVAGAWLVFLRGIRAGTSDGVLHIQPAPALMEALDALFAMPGEPAF